VGDGVAGVRGGRGNGWRVTMMKEGKVAFWSRRLLACFRSYYLLYSAASLF
jgi:hypothetical protein